MVSIDWLDSFYESHQVNTIHYLTDLRREAEEQERQERRH